MMALFPSVPNCFGEDIRDHADGLCHWPAGSCVTQLHKFNYPFALQTFDLACLGRLRLTGADLKMKIFFTNKAVSMTSLEIWCSFGNVFLWVLVGFVMGCCGSLCRLYNSSCSASIRQGYCQMDLNSERIYVKSKNAEAMGP